MAAQDGKTVGPQLDFEDLGGAKIVYGNVPPPNGGSDEEGTDTFGGGLPSGGTGTGQLSDDELIGKKDRPVLNAVNKVEQYIEKVKQQIKEQWGEWMGEDAIDKAAKAVYSSLPDKGLIESTDVNDPGHWKDWTLIQVMIPNLPDIFSGMSVRKLEEMLEKAGRNIGDVFTKPWQTARSVGEWIYDSAVDAVTGPDGEIDWGKLFETGTAILGYPMSQEVWDWVVDRAADSGKKTPQTPLGTDPNDPEGKTEDPINGIGEVVEEEEESGLVVGSQTSPIVDINEDDTTDDSNTDGWGTIYVDPEEDTTKDDTIFDRGGDTRDDEEFENDDEKTEEEEIITGGTEEEKDDDTIFGGVGFGGGMLSGGEPISSDPFPMPEIAQPKPPPVFDMLAGVPAPRVPRWDHKKGMLV